MKYYIVNRLEKLVLMKVPEELDTRFQQEYGSSIRAEGQTLGEVLDRGVSVLQEEGMAALEPQAEKYKPG